MLQTLQNSRGEYYESVSLPKTKINTLTPSQGKQYDDVESELSSLKEEIDFLRNLIIEKGQTMQLLIGD